MSFDKMKFIIATLLLVACAQARHLLPHPMISMVDFRRGIDTRIISGAEATKGMFPWQAALLVRVGSIQNFCGGSLISDKWVLTAAHCTVKATDIEVQLGGVDLFADMEYIETSTKFINHEHYNGQSMANDIGLIALPKAVTLTANIQVIPLATSNYPDVTGLPVTVSGYGDTDFELGSNTLLYVELTVVSNKQCSENFDFITDSTICAIGNPDHSTCWGDDGGPLVHFNKSPTLVGVISFVHDDGCTSGRPSGCVRVSSYLDWIHQHTGIKN